MFPALIGIIPTPTLLRAHFVPMTASPVTHLTTVFPAVEV